MQKSACTFGKKEKLCSRKIIDRLFAEGDSFMAFPVRVQFTPVKLPENVPVQVVISVSKKRFKKAVTRNLLKRRMREAYRLNKQAFCTVTEQAGIQLAVAFLYVSNEALSFQIIEKGMKKAIGKLIAETGKHETTSENI
jgi:ribonuclease P protein component